MARLAGLSDEEAMMLERIKHEPGLTKEARGHGGCCCSRNDGRL